MLLLPRPLFHFLRLSTIFCPSERSAVWYICDPRRLIHLLLFAPSERGRGRRSKSGADLNPTTSLSWKGGGGGACLLTSANIATMLPSLQPSEVAHEGENSNEWWRWLQTVSEWQKLKNKRGLASSQWLLLLLHNTTPTVPPISDAVGEKVLSC